MDIFFAIAEPTRRAIVELLAKKGRLSATDISGKFRMSMPAISQHLKVLREANVVSVEKDGQKRMYKLNVSALHEVEHWATTLEARWNERLDKLEALLKKEST
jgi:DNA-binding transcriptional ArsR family regulator